jgi:hypothetical protein
VEGGRKSWGSLIFVEEPEEHRARERHSGDVDSPYVPSTSDIDLEVYDRR